MDVIFLGTGAPLARGRQTMGLLVVAPGCEPLLIDTCGGFGLATQVERVGYDLADLGHVILTHQHLDHTGGVPALLFARRDPVIHANVQTQTAVDTVLRSGFPEVPLGSRVVWHEAVSDNPVEIGGYDVQFFAVEHRVPTLAVRITAAGKTLAYGADCLACPELIECARDADLFICDAICETESSRRAWAKRARHATATEAASAAALAGAGRLALVHTAWFARTDAMLAESAAAFDGPVSLPDDLERLTV